MRLNRLDLLRFGPFTDKTLNFRPGARLHLVFGPNEAGKSSSLAAIGDLLFGFAKRREFDFLHEASTLRVGAEIAGHNGETLNFRRRRGNKKTLLANDDGEGALQEDALAPFLGNLDREVFSRAFGLNSETLRDGGSAMLQSEGEMGAALFAAASGLTGLARMGRTLESEADGIFAPRASKERSFYQALERYDTALGLERQKELKATDWRTLIAGIEATEQRLAEIKAERTAISAALLRLARLRLLQPLIEGVDERAAKLDEFSDLPEVQSGFVAACAAALQAAEGASGQERNAEDEVAAANASLAAIDIDQAMLEHYGEIVELFSRRGDYLSKLEDTPRIEAERDELAATLEQFARRLGLADVEDLLQRQPPDMAIEAMRALIERGQVLQTTIAGSEARLLEEREAFENQEQDGSEGGALIDPKPWRDQITALAPDLKQLEDQLDLETSLSRLTQKLEDSAARLVPPVTEIEALSRHMLPSRDAINTHRASFERILADRRAATIELESIDREIETIEQQILGTESGGPIAYGEALAVARQERDSTFDVLRGQLLRTGQLVKPSEAAGIIAQFHEQSAEADALADQAIADAERISRHASYTEKLAELQQQRPETEHWLAQLADEQTRTAQAYGALFAPFGVVPIGPDPMITWLNGVETLLADRRDALSLAHQIGGLDRLGERLHGALLNIAAGLGLDDVGSMPPAALSRLVQTQIEEVTASWSAQVTRESLRQAAMIRIGRIQEIIVKARREERIWLEQFDAALPDIGVTPGTGLAGAAGALAAWAGVPETRKQRANRAGRITGMRRDTIAFEEEVFALCRQLTPVLVNLPAPQAIDTLRERAEAARAAKTRRDDALYRLGLAEAKFAAARTAHDNAYETLSALAAMLPDNADLHAELDRLEERATLRAELETRRREFLAQAEGLSEDEVREDLADFDRERAQYDVEDLQRSGETLHAENNELYAQLGQLQGRREALEAGTGAELAALQRTSAATEILASARQWVILKIASSLLGAAIDRHREEQSDPLMVRAGALFATLTGGSFSGLMQDYGEDDQPRLVGVRRSGERVAINGMSEGTRDQLYLSLRLAYLEDYAGRAEPVPFIGDDIFQTFDDERTASGLQAFASTSSLFQPILFTHHLSVVAIAQRVLNEDLDLIEL